MIFQIFDIHNTVAQDCTVTVTHCFIDLSGHEIEKKKVYFAEITNMVCEKCEKKGKLGKVITPDPWKAGASNTTQPGGRKVGENKLLTASKNRFNPLTTEFKKCRICKVSPSQQTGRYGTTELLLCDNLRCLTCILTNLVFSKKSTRWALTTASSALTRKGSVPCAG